MPQTAPNFHPKHHDDKPLKSASFVEPDHQVQSNIILVQSSSKKMITQAAS
jgi:hypothetical protein